MDEIVYIVRLVNKETSVSYFGTIEASADDIVAAASAAVKVYGEDHRVVGLYPEEHWHRSGFDYNSTRDILADEQEEENGDR